VNQGYLPPLVALHWLTLLLIAAAFGIGIALDDMPLSPLKLQLYMWHKSIGMLVLLLLPLRVFVRQHDPFDPAEGVAEKELLIAKLMHGALYLFMLVVPLLGWLASSAAGFKVVMFGVLPLTDLIGKDKALADSLKDLHEGAVLLLLALVAVHALAAIYHHRVRHDGVLARMVPHLRRKS
jgi:cytochrome b561